MISRRSRNTAVATVATTALFALTACSSGGGSTDEGAAPTDGEVTGEITLGYSAGGEWGTYIEAQVARIEEEYPDLDVTTVVYPTYDDLLNQLPTELAAGTAPDLIQWDGAAPVAQYATEGVLAPLDEAVADAGKDLEVYPESLITGWTIDDQLYGLPVFLQNSAMAFNTSLLAQAGINEVPSTLDEYAAAAQAVADTTDSEGVVILDTLFHIAQYMYAFGGGFDYGRTISSEENVAGLTFLVDLFKNDAAATAQELGATWDGEAFAGNKAAMSDAGPWYVSFMELTAPDVEYSLVPLVGPEEGDQTVVSYSGGYSINGATDNFSAAWAALEILTDEQAQEELLASGTQVPAMTDYIGQYRDATPAYAAFTDEIIGNGRSLDYPLQTTEFGTDLVTGFQEMIFNQSSVTPQELLDTLQEKYGR